MQHPSVHLGLQSIRFSASTKKEELKFYQMEFFETINQLELSSTCELIDWDLTFSPDSLGEFTSFPAMQQNTDAGFSIGLTNSVEISTQGQVNQQLPVSNYGADLPQKSSSTLKMRTPVRSSPEYIKKPLNAFMLYAKENRPILKQLYDKQDSASVNKLLGQMWKTLTQDDKQKYFEEAQRLFEEHAIMYPNWSTRDNYGKKKKRKCCHAAPRCTSRRPTATSVAAYPLFIYPVAGDPASPPQVSAYPVYANPVTAYPASAPVTSPVDYPVTAHQVDADPGFVQPVTAYPASFHQVDADPGFVQLVTAYPSAAPTATLATVPAATPATVPETCPFFTSFDVTAEFPAAAPATVPETCPVSTSFDETAEFTMPLSLELELNDFLKEHGDKLFDDFEDLDLSVFDL
ncbi:uncharacterized protein LOC144196666 [Stigmatopora nigra]